MDRIIEQPSRHQVPAGMSTIDLLRRINEEEKGVPQAVLRAYHRSVRGQIW